MRQLEQVARRLGEVADVRWRADLVGDDGDLVALAAELEHRLDEVAARPAEQPRTADDPAVAHLALALELRPSVDGERLRLVRLDVRLALRPVEDVVGRVVDDRHAEGDYVARPADVDCLRSGGICLGAVDVGPSGRVQHELGADG